MQVGTGKSIVNGIAIGKLKRYKKKNTTISAAEVADAAAEVERFEDARAKAIDQQTALYEKALAEAGPQAVDVPRYQFHRGSFPAVRSRRRFLTVFPHFTRFSPGNQLALFGEKEYSKIKMIRGVSWGRKAESGI